MDSTYENMAFFIFFLHFMSWIKWYPSSSCWVVNLLNKTSHTFNYFLVCTYELGWGGCSWARYLIVLVQFGNGTILCQPTTSYISLIVLSIRITACFLLCWLMKLWRSFLTNHRQGKLIWFQMSLGFIMLFQLLLLSKCFKIIIMFFFVIICAGTFS